MHGQRIWGTLDPFIEGGGYLGRSAANAGFLDALLDADPFDAYHFFLPSRDLAKELAAHLCERRPQQAGKILATHRLDLEAALKKNDYYCFHCSDCINHPGPLARLRNLACRQIFPITSLTHSLCYSGYAKEFLAHLWPGCTPRDAVVATSRAGRSAVLGYYDALRQGYGLASERFPQPRVEVIPLGIRVQDFAPDDHISNPTAKATARQAYGLSQEQTVLLVFGRLDHASKLDALPLLRALQRVVRGDAGPRIAANTLCLVMAGGAAPETERGDAAGKLAGAAANLGLSFLRVANPDEAQKRRLFAAADIFVSPVDNLQETFGLSLLEAGAMGLPAVVSDFDGYRDIVEHELTGFLIPTLGPPPDPSFDAFAALAFDNQSLLRYGQQTVVDVAAMAGAIAALAAAPELRRAMGQAARERVARLFGWETVAAAYVALWERLWSVPVDAAPLRDIAHPLQTPYGRVFAAHPSQTLDATLRLQGSRTGKAVQQGLDHYIVHDGIADLVDHAAVKRLAFLARNPATVATLAARLADEAGLSPEAARFHLLWALKHDILERVAPSTARTPEPL